MAKIVKTERELLNFLEKEREQGKNIVFANGCFDLLHVGHIRYLRGAKKQGDVLVVGVNSDDSVKRLKNRWLPVIPQKERLEVLSAIDCIDYLILFKDKTADRILRLIKPNVHAKGTDYTKKTVPERRTAQKIGAKIAITGDKKNHSTTDLLKKISDIYKRMNPQAK